MREINARRITVVMQDGTRFNGLINVGSIRRLSDYFRKAEGDFMVIFNAVINDDTEPGVFFLNRNSIAWAKPHETNESEKMLSATL